MMGQRYLPGLFLLLGLTSPAHAQVSAELRGGAVIGNHAPAAAGLEMHPGLALSASIEYRATDIVSVYGGFSRAAFGCEEGFCTNRDVTVTTQGIGAGVRLHPGPLPWPWVRAGLLFYDAAVDASDRSGSVPHALGVELGMGVSVPITRRLSVLPGIYYRTQAGDDRTTLLGADVGLRMSFD